MAEASEVRASRGTVRKWLVVFAALVATAQVGSWLVTDEELLRATAWVTAAQRHLEAPGYHPGGDCFVLRLLRAWAAKVPFGTLLSTIQLMLLSRPGVREDWGVR